MPLFSKEGQSRLVDKIITVPIRASFTPPARCWSVRIRVTREGILLLTVPVRPTGIHHSIGFPGRFKREKPVGCTV
jgi:hypothetical protein